MSDLYDAQFREQSGAQGRWMSPDPAGVTATDLNDPQSWNLYAYVRNNPHIFVDPFGLGWGWGVSSPPEFLYYTHNQPDDNILFNKEIYSLCPCGPSLKPWVRVVVFSAYHPHRPITLGIRAPGQTYSQCLAGTHQPTASINPNHFTLLTPFKYSVCKLGD